MTTCYKVFGLPLVSNHPIPGLPLARIESPCLRVTFGRPPSICEIDHGSEELAYTSVITTPSGEPTLRIFRAASGINHLVYSDGVEFWLDPATGRIWAAWSEALTLDYVAPYLLGPVLGIFLSLRGFVSLHASAIVLHEQAVLFVGEAGAGKSTTAAALSKRGHALLADDIVGIIERDGKFFAIPAYPYVSLWPQSAEMICGPDAELPNLFPGFEKQRFTPSTFQESPVPIADIFVLGERSCGENLPRIEDMSLRDQLLALVANSYATRILSEKSRADEFRFFGRMISAMPIRRLFAHSEPTRLFGFCEFIEQECSDVRVPAAGVSKPRALSHRYSLPAT